VAAAVFDNPYNPVEHQHGRQWQARIALPEQLAPCASQQSLKVEARFTAQHTSPVPAHPRLADLTNAAAGRSLEIF
jgi:hypothetical protein